MLDLAGESIYRSLHATFLSSIDPINEPTIYCIVYNHLEYTTERHDEYLGVWIESILMHTQVSSSKIQTKLIGIEQKKTCSKLFLFEK